MLERAVFIEPTYPDFLRNKLFDLGDARLNRDNQLIPGVRLREAYERMGIPVYTADYLREKKVVAHQNDYWSLGDADKYREFVGRSDVKLKAFIMMEPPLIKPDVYRKLPEICRDFELTYLYNTECSGYSLPINLMGKVRKLYFPQPYEMEVEPYWSREKRLNKFVIVAGNHNPRLKRPEYYSARIELIAQLVNTDGVDLYGRGWNKWWSLQSAWPAYWMNIRSIQRAYRGSCSSKMEILSRYRFSACFENAPMMGYITEKIFDCFYAGVVPVYLGAPDITKYIPKDAYIDMREFSSYKDVLAFAQSMSDLEWKRKREVGREFISKEGKLNYTQSLERIVLDLDD
jgi:hypothetical protein